MPMARCIHQYTQTLCNTISAKKAVNANLPCSYEEESLEKITALVEKAYAEVKKLEKELVRATKPTDALTLAMHYKNKILATMEKLRKAVDEMESLVCADYWPFPTYGELLFGVRE